MQGIGIEPWRAKLPAIVGEVSADSPAYRVLRDDGDRFRVTGLWGHLHVPNTSELTGIEDLQRAFKTQSVRSYVRSFALSEQAKINGPAMEKLFSKYKTATP